MKTPAVPANEAQRLQALHERAILDTPAEERFDRLTRLARHIFGTQIALVSLVDADRQWFKSRQGLDACETGREISFCGHAILATDIFEIADALLDPRFADNPLVTGAPHIRFYAGAPLATADGYNIGTLCVVDENPRHLTAAERQALRDLADCVEDEINALELRQSQAEIARLSRVASETTNGVIITDALGRVNWVNAGFTRMSGYGLDEMQGRRPGDILHGRDTDPATVAQMSTALARCESFEVEIVNYAKSGQPYWVHISCNPLRDGAGEPHGFMAIESDITARKAANEKLRETTLFLESIFENVPSMIFLKHASDLRFAYFNRAGEALLGHTRAELLGRSDYDFFPKEQADFFTAKDRAVLESHDVVDIAEETVATPLGSRVLHTRKLSLRDDHGKPQYLLGISEDITERKKIERMKNEFVSTVSHELRTPLTVISGALGLVVGDALGEIPGPMREMIAIAHKNSQRLAHLIDDLLDMERLEAGKLPLDMRVQDLMLLVEQAIHDNQIYADQYQVRFELAKRVDGVAVAVDTQRLQQVLANLLSNAAKFSPQGGTVHVRVIRRDAAVRVEVIDHGPGIPAEFRERIFQKFSQADGSDTRHKGGSGLGLAISRELVQRMGGRIGFDSVEGAGASFYFELPIFPTPSAEDLIP